MKKFIIRDSEAGNFIESFSKLIEAENKIIEFENQDKKDGIYTPNFYEIYYKLNLPDEKI
jgi:hypothetical protein